jgi:uncharacterized BrkB/YihY/UPF0761 family membrane protein
MKAILLVVLGAVGYHLYANAADRDQLIYTIKHTVSTTAEAVADTTKPSLIENINNR